MLLSDWYFKCIGCGQEYNELELFRCKQCNDLLSLERKKLPEIKKLVNNSYAGIWKYAEFLPVSPEGAVTLGEGSTPLVSSRLHEGLLYKVEGQNPTGSFKDRGMSVAITDALLRKKKYSICASTGNTSSSLAAYSSRAGITSIVLVPEGKVAPVKISQAINYGATIYSVAGNFDLALQKVTELQSLRMNVYLANSINPYRIEGQKTVSFEIYEQLGEVPDYVIVPVGNAGNISAIWKGFKELSIAGIKKKPVMIGVQAEGAAPLADAFSSRKQEIVPVDSPETVASAIRIGKPVSWKKALRAITESSGIFVKVSDSEIISARNELAKKEGILVETASAASFAAYKKIKKMIRKKKAVCILTGSGLKELDTTELHEIPELKDIRELGSL